MKPLALLTVTLAALTVALAACGGAGAEKSVVAADIVTTTTTTAPSTTTTTTARIAASYDDLSRAIITAVPSGYVVQPNDVGDTGPSDLTKAVRDDDSADARAVLTRDGFVRGYQRLWVKSENEQVIAFLYQFNDHAGALDYQKRAVSDFAKGEQGVTVTTFDVPGIDGAAGASGQAPSFASSVVVFAKGPYLMQLVVNGPALGSQPDMVRALATDQFSRL